MTSRRSFLTTLGMGIAATSPVLAQPQRRRSLFDFIFNQPETVDPGVRPDPSTWSNDTITAAWIGHATVLINFFGTMIITDPVFSNRIGIRLLRMFTLGPRRLVAPALSIKELPKIDLILLSHAHMDHCDLPSLRRFDPSIPIVMAKNTQSVIRSLNRRSVTEVDWNESIIIGDLSIEGLRVKHFGWRFPWESDRSKGDWNGRSYNAYSISKNGRTIVFGGDTAYQEFFKSLAERNIPIDLVILPIGAYDPWIAVHANPEQAVAMANHMKAKAILPVHWNTFILSSEPQHEPIERLKAALKEHSPSLALDAIGQTWKLGAV
ncbi:MAG TPA: MBL fold metallo-hydrolase [Bacteroidota bacterium]|nr:MBL fold metallo-hydrolase [Bacteroidota bacterium]